MKYLKTFEAYNKPSKYLYTLEEAADILEQVKDILDITYNIIDGDTKRNIDKRMDIEYKDNRVNVFEDGDIIIQYRSTVYYSDNDPESFLINVIESLKINENDEIMEKVLKEMPYLHGFIVDALEYYETEKEHNTELKPFVSDHIINVMKEYGYLKNDLF